MLSIAIARNGMEKRIATFPYCDKKAENLLKRLEAKGIPACMSWSTESTAYIVGCTSRYFDHCA